MTNKNEEAKSHLGQKDGNYQTKIKICENSYHILIALLDEPNPDHNHVHIKWRASTRSYLDYAILCDIKCDNVREHSRRVFIEKINAVTGLSLNYKDV